MPHRTRSIRALFLTSLTFSALLLFSAAQSLSAQTPPAPAAQSARTPADTVREFYKALFEKRFREAFNLSMFKPAIETLSPADFDELKPDFEAMASRADKVLIKGEQISGEVATVFVKDAEEDAATPPSEVKLMRAGNMWIIGDAENAKAIQREGKNYFLNLRINTHHAEVQDVLIRIVKAQMAYSAQHNGLYGDMAALIRDGLLPRDIEGTTSTGYRFHITLGKDGRSYTSGAEPVRYGRTGRLSFYLDQNGIRSADTGGKPLQPKK